ncbi:MAG: FHA domain-containing protein [Magnetococcales bacterium]|nr:FHA domain-containing protein [Magnetococcales bacterium]
MKPSLNRLPPAPTPVSICLEIQEAGGGSSGLYLENQGITECIFGRAEAESTPGRVRIRLRDPFVSQSHCRLLAGPDGGWWIEDLGSRNGTRIGGRAENHLPVRQVRGAERLEGGMVIQIGRTLMTLTDGQEALRRAVA